MRAVAGSARPHNFTSQHMPSRFIEQPIRLEVNLSSFLEFEIHFVRRLHISFRVGTRMLSPISKAKYNAKPRQCSTCAIRSASAHVLTLKILSIVKACVSTSPGARPYCPRFGNLCEASDTCGDTFFPNIVLHNATTCNANVQCLRASASNLQLHATTCNRGSRDS